MILPIGPQEGISLQAIFQPLKLLRDPLAAEDLEYEQRRPFLGENLEDNVQRSRTGSLGRDRLPNSRQIMPTVMAENAEEALRRSVQQRSVILGGPGTGKTTMLKHLGAAQAKKALIDLSEPVPIFISLAAFARSEKSLQSFLIDVVEDLDVGFSYGQELWAMLQDGKAFVCLDSLDEVDPKRRTEMIDMINRKAAQPGNVWVIGSRFTEFKGDNSGEGNLPSGNSSL